MKPQATIEYKEPNGRRTIVDCGVAVGYKERRDYRRRMPGIDRRGMTWRDIVLTFNRLGAVGAGRMVAQEIQRQT